MLKSSQDVFEYLQDKCPSLIKSYSKDTFSDIDGEVFLGLTPATVDMVFPQLSQRDKGLLLSRVEYLRSQSSPPESSIVRDVTPPLSYANRSLGLPAPSVDHRPVSRLDEDRFSSQYKRSFSPSRSKAAQPRDSQTDGTVAPLLGELPRVLIELWRSTDDPETDEFLAESWLPDLKELELKSQTLRIALRRSIKKRDTRIVLTRSWLGALVVTARYHRIGNRLDLHLTQAKELNVATHAYSEFFARVYVFNSEGPSLTLVHESGRNPVSRGSSVDFEEQITVKFGRVEEGAQFEAPKPQSKSKQQGVESADVLRDLMLKTEPGDALKVSLFDLMSFGGRGEIFKLKPHFNRFESYLLPTHEVSALTGTQFMFKSVSQIDSLSRDSDYMRNHSQVIELLLSSWGLGEDTSLEQGSWTGESWLFRHALLSAILLRNREGARRLKKAAEMLQEDRQLDVTENGFGEALFTLHGDQTAARQYWESIHRQSGIRSAYLPAPRAVLSELLAWSDN